MSHLGHTYKQHLILHNLQLSLHSYAVITTNFRHWYIWVDYSIARIVTYITCEHTPVYI